MSTQLLYGLIEGGGTKFIYAVGCGYKVVGLPRS